MIDNIKYPVLSKVDSPADLKQLELVDLKQLCTDVREYMIDTISEIGGHFVLSVQLSNIWDWLITWDILKDGESSPNGLKYPQA